MSEYTDYLEELRNEVETKAKRANQRLRQLEKSGIDESSRAYQATARKAYDGLPGYTQTKAGNIAFDRRLAGKTIAELEAEKEELDKFLDPGTIHTSTVRGYKESLRKSFEGYKRSTGDKNITFSEYQQMFGDEQNRNFGYMNVRAMQKVPGASAELVQEQIDRAVAEQSLTKRALGVANYVARVKEAVTEAKEATKEAASGLKLAQGLTLAKAAVKEGVKEIKQGIKRVAKKVDNSAVAKAIGKQKGGKHRKPGGRAYRKRKK